MSGSKNYEAVVEKIISEGRHGPYVVARSGELGTITFSLNSKVWQERDRPEPGMVVVLSQVRKKRAGWRAFRSRFFKPADEKRQKGSNTATAPESAPESERSNQP